jgi:DNA-binding SARP family transcriptional activator
VAATSTPHAPRLELHSLGAPSALLDGRPAPPDVHGRKHLALLIYLALSPSRKRTRSHLAGLLWPDKPESQARHSLNEAVRRLRVHVGPERLISEREWVSLDEPGLEVDALQFDAVADRQPAEAVRLFQGDFLEGFALDDAPPFEEWAAGERTRYRTRAAAALVACAEDALAASRYTEATDAAQRALALEPYAERAVGLQMRAAVLSGDPALALAVFHAFATRVAQELGEHPSGELVALADRIRAGHWRRTVPQQTDLEPPLVGGETIYREAFTALATSLQQGPRSLFVGGPPGGGKSRLLTECVQRLALEGAVTAVARPLESDHDAPWSTLRSLMRAGLHRAPGSAGADPGALRTLAALAPDGAVGPAPATDGAAIAGALASLLQAVAEEQPIGLAVDDAHFSDGASLEALTAAVAELRGVPVLLIVTSLPDLESMPRTLVRMQGEIGRRLPGTALQLEPLSEAASRELVLSLSGWCVDQDVRDRLARRMYFDTGGNPFLLVVLLRALSSAAALRDEVMRWPHAGETIDGPMPIPLPTLLRPAIAVQFAQLDEESRQVLRAASVGALAVDPDLVAAVTGLARERVEDLLVILERHHLLTFNGERYRFAAPVVAQLVRGVYLAAGERSVLQARAAAALATRHDLESRLLRVELLARIGPAAVAFAEAMSVADAAIAGAAPRAARRALAAAERALEGDEQRRRELDALRARVPA